MVTIKYNDTEANSYTWLQSMNDYLVMTEENFIPFTSAELDSCKHIENKYLCKKTPG